MQERAIKLKHLYLQKLINNRYMDEIKKFNIDTKRDLPQNLVALEKIVKNCSLCELSKSRTKTVFGEGNESAKIMFIGEAPGESEDMQGRPFVGRAGLLLEKIINTVLELQRDQVYIANILKCRPPNNRVPEYTEAKSCLPYLLMQIESVNPDLLVALGATAYKILTEDKSSISEIRGRVLEFGGRKLIATFHPSYLLRNPSAKKEAYQDFLTIRSYL